ncbi:MAG: hypothetical protein HQK77_03750 [Desulfobacterales bacterium]|nr:hypothetical protein [Desulfobacterales bacterium]
MNANSSDKIMIYLYSCETNINNYKDIKFEFDNYFEQFGNYEFQPFIDKTTFENQIQTNKNCIIILSGWHYKELFKKLTLKPLLVSQRDDSKYQRRIVVSKTHGIDLNSIANCRIASAISQEYTKKMLDAYIMSFTNNSSKNKNEIPPAPLQVNYRILTVPKDIDALISVGFGMSTIALTLENSLDRLKTINPELSNKINILFKGEKTLSLIVAIPATFTGELNNIITFIKKMNNDVRGKKLKLFGIDGWFDIDPTDIQNLEG